MSKSRDLALAAAGLAVFVSASAVGFAQTQQQQQRQQPAQRAAPAPAAAPLPWANSPNAQILGGRVVRSDTPDFAPRRFGVGRPATEQEIAGWAIAVRPDGQGLPRGRGSVADGEQIYMAQCASCHGDFGESAGRWPMVAGGQGSIATPDPIKTVGSFWPYASTLFDYIRRTMPFGAAQSLTVDETYAVTAYVLYLNDIVTDQSFVLSHENFTTIRMPNERAFVLDDRETAEASFWREPCMTNCAPRPAEITGRARVLDVTPETRRRGGVE
jgi:cytochrome c